MKKAHQKTTTEQLLFSQCQNLQAERLAGLGFWEWDVVEDRLTYCSEGYARILGMTIDEALDAGSSTEKDHQIIHCEDRARYKNAERRVRESGVGLDIEYRIINAQGDCRYVHEVGEPIKNASGEVIRESGIVQDITAMKLVEGELAKTLADARRAERMAKLGTYTWNWSEGRIEACSDEFARLHGMTIEQVLSRYSSPDADYANIHPDDLEAYLARESDALATGKGYSAEYRVYFSKDDLRHVRELCEMEVNDEGEVIRSTGSIQDVTEQVRLQEQLQRVIKELHIANEKLFDLATTDSLTGLANRRALEEAFQQEQKRQKRNGGEMCLVLIDADHFKKINDQWGHDIGDKVLGSMAKTMLSNIRESDRAFRIGGEEFVLLLTDISLSGAAEKVKHIHDAFQKPCYLSGDIKIDLTISAGATIMRPDESLADCLARADQGLYQAKSEGRNCTVFV